MTKKQLVERLQKLGLGGDEEMNHYQADNVLLEYIGDPQVTDLFNAINKWYS